MEASQQQPMGAATTPGDDEEPLHLQQLLHISAALQERRQQSDSVTWVVETLPTFLQQAVQQGLAATQGDANPPTAPGTPAADDGEVLGSQQQVLPFGALPLPLSAAALQDDAATVETADSEPAGDAAAPALPAVVTGSQTCRVNCPGSCGAGGSGNSGYTDWVLSTCLVPEGLHTAAAALAGGGLAAMEVSCRVLCLQDCQPAPPSPALAKALKKVPWQQFGMSFRDFITCDDSTGILTLGVLPEAIVTPLALIVCSSNPVMPGAISGTTAAPEDGALPATQQTTQNQQLSATIGSSSNHGSCSDPSQLTAADHSGPEPSRKRGRSRRAKSAATLQPAALSQRREVGLQLAALEAALLQLKRQLPSGYMMSKLEQVLDACLAPIASSLTNIIRRAANPQLCEFSCGVLSCNAQQLGASLQAALQAAATSALAAKAASSTSGSRAAKRNSTRLRLRAARGSAAAATAAAVAAAAGDGMPAASGTEAEDEEAEQQEEEEEQAEAASWSEQQAAASASAMQLEQQLLLPAGTPGFTHATGDGCSSWTELSPVQLVPQQVQQHGGFGLDLHPCWQQQGQQQARQVPGSEAQAAGVAAGRQPGMSHHQQQLLQQVGSAGGRWGDGEAPGLQHQGLASALELPPVMLPAQPSSSALLWHQPAADSAAALMQRQQAVLQHPAQQQPWAACTTAEGDDSDGVCAGDWLTVSRQRSQVPLQQPPPVHVPGVRRISGSSAAGLF